MDKRQRTVYVKQAGEPGYYEAVVSTGEPDRDGDIIEPSGWELENYRKNPVVLFAHDPRLVVGGTDDIRVTDEGLVARFHFNLQTQLGRELDALYSAGDMRAFSVGFKPKEWEEIRSDPDPDTGYRRLVGYRFKRQELYEFSAVAIPANPNALVRMQKAAAAIPPDEGGWEFIEALKACDSGVDRLATLEQRLTQAEARITALAKLIELAPRDRDAELARAAEDAVHDDDYLAELGIVAAAALARSKAAGRKRGW